MATALKDKNHKASLTKVKRLKVLKNPDDWKILENSKYLRYVANKDKCMLKSSAFILIHF